MSNFVTIILKESKKREQKKAMLPPSINQLKNQATKLFKIQPPNKIQSIYTTDGVLITSISELSHGMEILVSTQLPDEDFSEGENQVEEAPKSSPRSSQIPTKPKTPISPKQTPPPNSMNSPKFVQPPPVNVSPMFGSKSPKMSVQSSGRQTPVLGQINEPSASTPAVKQPTSGTPGRSPSPMAQNQPPSPRSEEEGQMVRNTSQLAIIQQSTPELEAKESSARRSNSPNAPKRNTVTRDGVEEQIAEILSPDEKERRAMLSCGVDRDLIISSLSENLSGLFSDIMPSNAAATGSSSQKGSSRLGQSAKDDEEQPEVTNETLKTAIRQVPQVMQRFMTQNGNSEITQQAIVQKRLLNHFGEIPRISNALEQHINDQIKNGTFSTLGGFNVNFKTLIVGPRSSGKTTYLKNLAKNVYRRLIASGQYRHTFVFNVDFLQIKESFDDPIKFYNAFMGLALAQAASQRIDFQPYLDMITQYFEKIVQVDTFINLPTKFSLQDDFRATSAVLTELASNIFNAYKKSGSLSIFMTHVVTIPDFIAKAFGYSRVLVIADHIDVADVLVPCNDQLTRDTQNLPIIEFVKLLLEDNAFIAGCQDERHAIEAIDLIADDSTDILTGTDIVSVIDSDLDETHSSEIWFKLQVAGQTPNVLLRCEDCGGCPGFLARWDVIISMAQQYIIEEHKDKNSKKLRERKLALITKIRELAALVFAEEGDFGTINPYPGKINDFEIVQNVRNE